MGENLRIRFSIGLGIGVLFYRSVSGKMLSASLTANFLPIGVEKKYSVNLNCKKCTVFLQVQAI